jgi:hypothetical protein
LLTGKYNQGSAPEGSRAQLEGYGWLKDGFWTPPSWKLPKDSGKWLRSWRQLAQMSLAWV